MWLSVRSVRPQMMLLSWWGLRRKVRGERFTWRTVRLRAGQFSCGWGFPVVRLVLHQGVLVAQERSPQLWLSPPRTYQTLGGKGTEEKMSANVVLEKDRLMYVYCTNLHLSPLLHRHHLSVNINENKNTGCTLAQTHCVICAFSQNVVLFEPHKPTPYWTILLHLSSGFWSKVAVVNVKLYCMCSWPTRRSQTL